MRNVPDLAEHKITRKPAEACIFEWNGEYRVGLMVEVVKKSNPVEESPAGKTAKIYAFKRG